MTAAAIGVQVTPGTLSAAGSLPVVSTENLAEAWSTMFTGLFQATSPVAPEIASSSGQQQTPAMVSSNGLAQKVSSLPTVFPKDTDSEQAKTAVAVSQVVSPMLSVPARAPLGTPTMDAPVVDCPPLTKADIPAVPVPQKTTQSAVPVRTVVVQKPVSTEQASDATEPVAAETPEFSHELQLVSVPLKVAVDSKATVEVPVMSEEAFPQDRKDDPLQRLLDEIAPQSMPLEVQTNKSEKRDAKSATHTSVVHLQPAPIDVTMAAQPGADLQKIVVQAETTAAMQPAAAVTAVQPEAQKSETQADAPVVRAPLALRMKFASSPRPTQSRDVSKQTGDTDTKNNAPATSQSATAPAKDFLAPEQKSTVTNEQTTKQVVHSEYGFAVSLAPMVHVVKVENPQPVHAPVAIHGSFGMGHDPFVRMDAAASLQDSGARWIATTPRELEIAVADETHGMVHVRAEKSADNEVQAVVMASSEFAHQMLKAEVPQMASFLGQQTLPVERVQVVRLPEGSASTMDFSGMGQQGRNQREQGTDSGSSSRRQIWRQADAMVAQTAQRGAGLLSIRV